MSIRPRNHPASKFGGELDLRSRDFGTLGRELGLPVVEVLELIATDSRSVAAWVLIFWVCACTTEKRLQFEPLIAVGTRDLELFEDFGRKNFGCASMFNSFSRSFGVFVRRDDYCASSKQQQFVDLARRIVVAIGGVGIKLRLGSSVAFLRRGRGLDLWISGLRERVKRRKTFLASAGAPVRTRLFPQHGTMRNLRGKWRWKMDEG